MGPICRNRPITVHVCALLCKLPEGCIRHASYPLYFILLIINSKPAAEWSKRTSMKDDLVKDARFNKLNHRQRGWTSCLPRMQHARSQYLINGVLWCQWVRVVKTFRTCSYGHCDTKGEVTTDGWWNIPSLSANRAKGFRQPSPNYSDKFKTNMFVYHVFFRPLCGTCWRRKSPCLAL